MRSKNLAIAIWQPCVEPVVEGVESLLGEEARRAVVEVGVELVDHGLVAEHGEEADGEGQDGAAGLKEIHYNRLYITVCVTCITFQSVRDQKSGLLELYTLYAFEQNLHYDVYCSTAQKVLKRASFGHD